MSIASTYEHFEGVPSNQKSFSQTKMDISEDYYDSLSHICTEMCSKYGPESRSETYHICAYFNKDRIIMGENSPRRMGSAPISTHAEMDVLRKIYKSSQIPNTNKRIEKFDVLVIRLSKTGKIGSSRPCFHCISSMMNTPIAKIQYVYYSTNDGKIVREKLDTMLESELTIVSTGWRARTNSKRRNSGTGYSSDDSSDSSDSSSTTSSTTSNSSFKSRASSGSKKMVTVINSETGERKLVSETKFQRDLKRELKKKSIS